MNDTLKKLIVAGGLVAALAVPVAVAEHHGGNRIDRFMQADTNGDGAVSLEEVRAADAERFSDADASGDGFVSKDEMVAFHEARRAERRAARQDRRFDRLDANDDGLISAEEHAARETPRFERADANNDGLVTREEIDAVAPKRSGHHGPRD